MLLSRLNRKLELLAVHHLHVVDVEKVRVDDSLDDTSHKSHKVGLVLGPEPVDPVENVQCSVDSQGRNVVDSQVFGLASSLKHEQLGQNSSALQPHRERPQDVNKCESVVENQRQHDCWYHQVLHLECIDMSVGLFIGVLLGHEVDGVDGGSQVKQLHEEVVESACSQVREQEEVHVSGHKDSQIQTLGLERQTRSALARSNCVDQNEDGGHMGHVTCQSENVHCACVGVLIIVSVRVRACVLVELLRAGLCLMHCL